MYESTKKRKANDHDLQFKTGKYVGKINWLTFDGRFSIVQTVARGMTPADAMKMTNDKHVTGIQSHDDKLYPLRLKYEYVAKANKPIADPINDTKTQNFRPNRSDIWLVNNEPMIWTTAIAMDATYGSICDAPVSLKITTEKWRIQFRLIL